ncbi:hypothetical protein [Halostella salina]|uniref:hypothetical protein n=1 Tax=Halostella salina TaxID=1547897 RepID=UPI0013CF0F8E|nr:hypothetical protein [Halostella salina]
MERRCTLCRGSIDAGTERVLCQCGRLLHERCAAAHAEWCDADGTERWLGAVEL